MVSTVLADQCQLQIQKPRDIETTARGAAILAALGSGVFDSLDELHITWDLEQEFQPQRPLNQVEEDYQGWRHALQKAKG